MSRLYPDDEEYRNVFGAQGTAPMWLVVALMYVGLAEGLGLGGDGLPSANRMWCLGVVTFLGWIGITAGQLRQCGYWVLSVTFVATALGISALPNAAVPLAYASGCLAFCLICYPHAVPAGLIIASSALVIRAMEPLPVLASMRGSGAAWVSALGRIGGGPVPTSARGTIAGVELVLVAVALLLLAWRMCGTRRASMGLAILMAWTIGQWRIGAFLEKEFTIYGHHGHVTPPYWIGLPRVIVLAVCVSTPWIACRCRWRRLAMPRATWCLLPLFGVLSATHDWGRKGIEVGRTAMILNNGGFDWKTPSIDNPAEVGMFGLLPYYLDDAGWNIIVASAEDIEEYGVGAVDVLLVINCGKAWKGNARRNVIKYVEHGGGLLVLGDHTDVFGLMAGTNTLLNQWGVQFRFDSAIPRNMQWAGAARAGMYSLGDIWNASEMGVGIGASLDVEAPAITALSASYAFSDSGIRENAGGAFLGDYTYTDQEVLGDLPIVAYARAGKGHVLVYGDTSGFQNAELPWTFDYHVRNVLRAMAEGPATVGTRSRAIGIVLAVCLALILCLLSRMEDAWAVLFVTCVGAAVCWVDISRQSLPSYGNSTEGGNGAHPHLWIPRSYWPDIGHYKANWNGIGTLNSIAASNGYLVKQGGDIPPNAGPDDLIVLFGGGPGLSTIDQERLNSALLNGCSVLVASNGQDSGGLSGFLDEHGIHVEGVHLGSVPPREEQVYTMPRFVDASAVFVAEDCSSDVLFRYGGKVIVIVTECGAGHLVVIGDTRYLSDANIGGDWGMWAGNIRFIRDILVRLGGDEGGLPQWFDDPAGPM